ncbi:MAG TPA: hypothetical protein VFY54_01370 [Rubrobacter sp.]|nr:hypothetical protein [Rubrobacter sp.]
MEMYTNSHLANLEAKRRIAEIRADTEQLHLGEETEADKEARTEAWYGWIRNHIAEMFPRPQQSF